MTAAEFETAVGRPLDAFAHDCHAAALALVRSGTVGESRVARGFCPGVAGQHSWVVLGDDCYDRDAVVVDPTLWSYDETVVGIWTGKASSRPHEPHGSGSIWKWGRPDYPTGEIVTLDVEWSREARQFFYIVGPLDLRGWAQLAHAPVEGWPAAEIIGAIYDDERLSARVPIDIVGMLTDRNPSGLYLRRTDQLLADRYEPEPTGFAGRDGV